MCKCFNVDRSESKGSSLASNSQRLPPGVIQRFGKAPFQSADLGSASVNFMAAYHQKTCLNQSRLVDPDKRESGCEFVVLACLAFLEADGMAVFAK